MNKGLNIITDIHYAGKNEIISFNPGPSGSVRIEVAEWKQLEFVIGTISFSVKDDQTKSGLQYTASLSGNLKLNIINPGPVIIKLQFDSGDSLVIGETDLPVRMELTQSLSQKSMKIQHKSWHYPYKVIV